MNRLLADLHKGTTINKMFNFLDKAAKDMGMQLLIKKSVVPNRAVIFLPSGRQNPKLVPPCTIGAPREPAAKFSVGTIPNCQLYENQQLHDAQCEGGLHCSGRRTPVSSQSNGPPGLSTIQDIVPVPRQTYNQDRPRSNLFGSLLI